MITTSDGANKMLKQLEEEKTLLLKSMNELSTYVAAITEDPKEVKPDFDFERTISSIEVIDKKIIAIRHAKSVFNNTTIIKTSDDGNMTIGEALVKMPILKKRIELFKGLASNQPKARANSGILNRNPVIEYKYTNYDISHADQKYHEAQRELMMLQQALNVANATETFEIDIER